MYFLLKIIWGSIISSIFLGEVITWILALGMVITLIVSTTVLYFGLKEIFREIQLVFDSSPDSLGKLQN